MSGRATHREAGRIRLNLRYLAEYMASSERARNTILRKAKFPAIARLIQHDEALTTAAAFVRSPRRDPAYLTEEAERLRNRLADDDFERNTNEVNADLLDRFAAVQGRIAWPPAEVLPAGRAVVLEINGVRVSIGHQFRLRRVMQRTNRVRHGAGLLRYRKGKPLSADVAAWNSAFLLAALPPPDADTESATEAQLCLTIDAWTGIAYPAPGNSVTRFREMEAACEAIAQRWPRIEPPPGAVIE